MTGGGSGIGRAVALRLAAEGAAIGVVDVRAGATEAVATEVVAEGGKAFAAVSDVSDEAAVAAATPKSSRPSAGSIGSSPAPVWRSRAPPTACPWTPGRR